MRTLFVAYRVSDLERSLAFYTALGYVELGRVAFDDGGRLALLSFPEEPVATLELVYRPNAGPVDVGGFDHLAIQTDDLAETLATLTGRGLIPGPTELPGGPDGPQITWLEDPDGYQIELVEWPPGHSYGLTAADFANAPSDPGKEASPDQ
ncbi:VOC family protein [Kribbella sp. NBC_01245]|uniref:VOC family protein n=1 Tax=Kribbella sp. NBC_01245 TaxID=2903578 RepID=UPI002E280BE8|nr:VOC family protein [Kribbella sp. NBC_01245]